jgi:tetratricopeptide (TPR) repeat protein
MVCTVLMCCALLGAATGGDVASTASGPADLSVYDAAKSRAGKSGDAHVRLALWCEAHGMTAERLKHLGLAILYDPANTVARGLLGLVPHEGKWGRPDVVGQKIQQDPARQALIVEYLERRVRAAHKPDAQMKLAAWCDQNGLKAQALAHYNEVIRLDPTKESAWRHLGFAKQGSRWVKPEEAAAERSRAERQKLADKQWKPKLEKLRDGLVSKDKARRATAEHELAEVTDPRAVPMIWAVFVTRDERYQLAAVQLLGQIDSPAATSALAVLAVFNTRPNVRGRAASTLVRRDPRDYVGQLIGLIRKPFKYQVRPVNGPGSVGELFVEGERFNVRRLYEFQPINDPTMLRLLSQPSVPFDSFGAQYLLAALRRSGGALALIRSPQFAEVNALQAELSVGDQGSGPYNRSFFNTQGLPSVADLQVSTLRQRIRESNDALQRSLMADVQVVETTNAQINQINDLALPVVKSATGQDLGVDPEAWKTWWTNQQGYAYQSSQPKYKPTYTDIFTAQAPDYSSNSCFAAGTIVQTVDGPRMIESIQVGDRVLSQNTETGLLGFEPVVGVHQSKPATTLRIAAGDESIVATGIHRFWTAGKGWTMARDLKAGDRLRTIGGIATVRSIESGQTQPVFNLDVAQNRDFFVGTNGLLVHDFGFVQPVLEPFDREPDLTTLSPKATSAASR